MTTPATHGRAAMTAPDELLAALLLERYDNRWWPTPEPEPVEDDPITCRWRREIAEREHDRYESTRRRKGAA